MPLNDAAFAGVLKGIFSEMWTNPDAHEPSWYAEKLATAINDEIRNGDVQFPIPVQVSTATGIGGTTAIGKVK